MCVTRNPIHCIVPEHILKKLLEHDDPDVRGSALRTLLVSANIRGQRRALAPFMYAIANVAGTLRRTIYDAKQTQNLPGSLVLSEGGPAPADADVKRAYDGLGATYNFYKDAYGRNSIDNRGMRLDASVHYGQLYNNAFWNGRQMVFGDGDGKIFQSFTTCVDVIGHELTHGVTQYECNLFYDDQSGALNESISDVFGSLVKQYASGRQTVDQADWLIGKGLFGPSIKGKALRSMSAPGTAYDDPVLGKDPQPATMADYVQTEDDNHGVHLNSGIPNRAFYLAAKEIGGYAWEHAGRIWYTALPRLAEHSTFQEAADVIYQTAVQLYDAGSKQADAVGNAWATVGLAPRDYRRSASPRLDAAISPVDIDDLLDNVVEQLEQRVLAGVLARLNGGRAPQKKVGGGAK